MASRSPLEENIAAASEKHPKPDRTFQYGTAGFRMKADLLDSIVFRVGLLAALRSRSLGGRRVGVMITASHNPPEDNGVKVVDSMGEMLAPAWEVHATAFANAPTTDALIALYNQLSAQIATSAETDETARVLFARDTRTSGPRLVGCLSDALTAVGAEFVDYKLLTTPQLHYLVRCANTYGKPDSYGEVSEEGYYKKLGEAFGRAMRLQKPSGHVVVDCANGVGGPKLRELVKHLNGIIDIKIVNDDVLRAEALNSQSGADYVKTKQQLPPNAQAAPLERLASLDGDADRLVYYFKGEDGKFNLLDGDRIATLAASFIGDLGRQSGLADELKIGVVQTAYANGASTHYINGHLKLPVVCTPTGVKHLHHAATQFDIGVYFEANGHGTILFSPNAENAIAKHEPQSPAQKTALDYLQAVLDLINQTVGDALSDMLLVEVILAHKGWTVQEWVDTYKDLPNRLVRVEVPDRSRFKTTDAERKVVEPQGIQSGIDALVEKYQGARSFVRASGTEDAVRVYAEAASKVECEELAKAVANLVTKGA